MKMVFDTETNGLSEDKSVLSFSAVIIDDDYNIVQVVDRYYYPEEEYNKEAIRINGLTKEVIKDHRKNATYPMYFKDDKDVVSLFEREEITEIIGHNISFDISFVEHHLKISLSGKKQFCTMIKTKYLYNAPYKIEYACGFEEPKYPKLSEAIRWAKIDTEEILKRTGKGYRDNLFTVYCTLELYKYLKIK